jgi:hypothetical protein
MNLYVIQKTNGEYVRDMRHATPVDGSSYTRTVRQARLFNSLEDARSASCSNERAVSVESLLTVSTRHPRQPGTKGEVR